MPDPRPRLRLFADSPSTFRLVAAAAAAVASLGVVALGVELGTNGLVGDGPGRNPGSASATPAAAVVDLAPARPAPSLQDSLLSLVPGLGAGPLISASSAGAPSGTATPGPAAPPDPAPEPAPDPGPSDPVPPAPPVPAPVVPPAPAPVPTVPPALDPVVAPVGDLLDEAGSSLTDVAPADSTTTPVLDGLLQQLLLGI